MITNKLKRKTLLLTLTVILFCNFSYGQLFGKYKSAEYNYFETGVAMLSGIDRFIFGTELTLNSDSTFQMSTCSVIQTGNWNVASDSLYLIVMTRKSRGDSIDFKGELYDWLKKPCKSVVYKIDDEELYRIFYLNNEGKSYKALDKLERD